MSARKDQSTQDIGYSSRSRSTLQSLITNYWREQKRSYMKRAGSSVVMNVLWAIVVFLGVFILTTNSFIWGG